MYAYYGDEFTIEHPTSSGRQLNLWQISEELANRLIRIFLRDEHGRQPVHGATKRSALARQPPVL